MEPGRIRSPGEVVLPVSPPPLTVRGAPVAGPLLPGVPSAEPPDVVDRPSGVSLLPEFIKLAQALVPKSARPSKAIAIRDMILS
jgi:hypothetical protein